MVYPWVFEDYGVLRPLREAADLLAEMDGWPALYDAERLRANEVPVAAAVYANDMYVERAYSEETAKTIRGSEGVAHERVRAQRPPRRRRAASSTGCSRWPAAVRDPLASTAFEAASFV